MHANQVRYYKKRRRCLKKIMQLRRQQLLLIITAKAFTLDAKMWELERTKAFWEIDCQVNTNEFFKNNFRMYRETFQCLCGILKNLQKKDTNLRKAIPLEKRVAIALYTLGSSAEYRSIGNLFGIGKSTVCEILIDFCNEVWIALRPLYLNNFFLSQQKIKECVKGFELMGFPQCLGAIDGCHIEIHPNSADAVDYFNYKGWYSTVLLALVDYRYRFLYINVGSPGRCNDSQIYEKSLLKKQLHECTLLQGMKKTISGANVPILIIGDSAFRFSPTLMKPYPFNVEGNDTMGVLAMYGQTTIKLK